MILTSRYNMIHLLCVKVKDEIEIRKGSFGFIRSFSSQKCILVIIEFCLQN